ncbi:MAG: UDP-N-acetylglucosamine 2-epimerase (non-hydrolyzing) [Legionellales bacterium]|nr:UDP-N-acetylglucosamine 2-epimerase (non-hydrolyzing) [Legionellales bacterium]
MTRPLFQKVLTVFGTRPEAIKMAPLVKTLNADERFEHTVCVTGQHREMLDEVLDIFEITPDFDLNIIEPNQSLSHITSKILSEMPDILHQCQPDIVLVHGDTSTTFAAALASFYAKIKVGHIEAGLRTGDIYTPWPEEANRKLTASITHLHFAPTQSSANNLMAEGVDAKNIYITGNTVIDALFLAIDKIQNTSGLLEDLKTQYSFLSSNKKTILFTGHRRDIFGSGFEDICKTLVKIAEHHQDIQIVCPLHLNPNIQTPANQYLKGIDNIYIIKPVGYLDFIYLMDRSDLILTDSGGIQEEAPTLGKPVLVMRETTERLEALNAGTVKLVGTSTQTIISEVEHLLEDTHSYQKISRVDNPYGDGNSCQKIISVLSGENTIHRLNPKV